jgi:bile acid:Na+ symporter, BASS family
MTVDRLINLLVTVMLIEMMIALGLSVTFADLAGVVRNWRLVLLAAIANYVCIPAITVALLMWFQPADAMISVGFLILAVCPGAPFGPPCTKIAKGNVPMAVGLMVVLAASSALAAPALLQLLLPWVSSENSLHVDAVRIVVTLFLTQLLPLGLGLALRRWRPGLAERLKKPANMLSSVLGLVTIAVILVSYFPLLAEIRLRGWFGMALLLLASSVAGWLLGGPGAANRRAMALTTNLRNLGVGLVIAAGNFPGSAAVTTALAAGRFLIIGSLLLAFAWARR